MRDSGRDDRDLRLATDAAVEILRLTQHDQGVCLVRAQRPTCGNDAILANAVPGEAHRPEPKAGGVKPPLQRPREIARCAREESLLCWLDTRMGALAEFVANRLKPMLPAPKMAKAPGGSFSIRAALRLR